MRTWVLTTVVAALSGSVFASPFTYQGELTDGGVPADGMYDMVFSLVDAPVIGVALQQIVMNNVVVSDGLFEVDLDYLDSLFDGSDRWLAINVDGTSLNPRTQIQYSPYAIRAINAQDANNSEHADIASDLEVPWVVVTDTDIVDATSTRGIAVRGYAMSGSLPFPGVLGETDSLNGSAVGVLGRANSQSDTSPGTGVRGETNATGSSGYGVHGIHSGNGSAVYGENFGGGTGVSGQSLGVGVLGSTPNGTGVRGISTNGLGMWASSFTGSGLQSRTTSGTAAVEGSHVDSGTEFFGATEFYGVLGQNLNTSFGNGIGVRGEGGRYGVQGIAHTTVGSGSLIGVLGDAGTPTADADDVFGVVGVAEGSAGFAQQNTLYGVYGVANVARLSDTAYGIYGRVIGDGHIGPNAFAGYFEGDVHVMGTLSKSSGSFKIDHPLTPETKYLSHSFIESPDMMNIYNGVAELDREGTTVITLPDYFEALNQTFRYQLTAIGASMPNLYISSEVSANEFAIAGGVAGAKVSWQVTGIRHDASALARPIIVEEDKKGQHLGKYLDPRAYGFGDERAIHPSPKQN